MRKLCAIIGLVCILMTVMSVVALAEDQIMPLDSEIIRSTSVTISVSNGKVVASALVRTTTSADELGFTSIILYEKVNGVWKVAASSNKIYGNDQVFFQSAVNCTVVSGREYKAVCTSYAKNKGLSDTGSARVSSFIAP